MKLHACLFSCLFLCLLFAGNVVFAQNIRATLEISNIPLKDGTLLLAWYDNAADFEKSKMVIYRKIPIRTQAATTIYLDDIKVGEYAIKVLFDENGNEKIDKNFVGMPVEAYGFSNNVYPAGRAANYEEAKFQFSAENAVIKIKMKQ